MGVSVSVAELLPGVGSVSPDGTATVAVLTRLPVAAPEILQTAVKVAVPPTGKLTVAFILPAPLAGPVAPPAYTAVHAAEVIAAGKLSVTVAPVLVLGPALDATIVYVVVPPAV